MTPQALGSLGVHYAVRISLTSEDACLVLDHCYIRKVDTGACLLP